MKKIVVVLLSGCFCLSMGVVAQEQISLSKNIQANAVAPLAQSGYLGVSDRTGITWFDIRGKGKANLSTPAELLDVRENIEVNYKGKVCLLYTSPLFECAECENYRVNQCR